MYTNISILILSLYLYIDAHTPIVAQLCSGTQLAYMDM